MNNTFLNIDFLELGQVFFRCLLSLITLFFVTKMLGKKQVSQLSMFDYVIGISIGNFAAEITMGLDDPLINGLLSIFVFGFVAYIISFITMKSICLRRFIIGSPRIIIEKGRIVEKNMKKEMIDINDLLEQCRNSGYFDIGEIEYAIMEANGKISFLPKGEYKPVVCSDINTNIKKQGLCANVIIDGYIMINNLKNSNKDEKWLKKQLKVYGVKDISEVLLATIDVNDKLNIYKKNNKDSCNVLE